MPLRLPKVRADLEYFDQELEGDAVIVVRDPVRGTYFKYNPLQAAMLRALDGVRSLDEMVAALSAEFEVEIPRVAAERFVVHARKMMLLDVGSYPVTEAKAARQVIRALDRQGLGFRGVRDEAPVTGVASAEAALVLGGIRQLQAGQPSKALDYFYAVLEINPDNVRVNALVAAIQTAYIKALSGATSDFPTFGRFNPTRILSFLDRTIGRLVFRWLALVPLIGLVALAIYCYSITPYPETRVGAFDIALAVTLTLVHSFLHEFGHGLACYHFGGTVPEIGFTLFYYIRPFPYCDTSSSYLFRNRNHQVATQLAGTVVSLVFLCLLFVALAVIHPSLFIYQAALLILWISVVLMFVNLIPFVKFDGYYALCDYWGVPNLRERSMKLLRGWLSSRLLGLPADEEPLTPGKRQLFFGFAVLSSLFTAVWIYWAVFKLLAPTVERFRGMGLIVAVGVLAYALRGTLVLPVWGLLRLVIRERRRVFTLRRTLMLAALAAAVVGPWFIQWPVMVDAELVLVPSQRVDVRAQTAGRIEQILVHEGDAVAAGQPLAILRNDDLVLAQRVAEAELASIDARLAELRNGARLEELRLASHRVGMARATQAKHAHRAAVASSLADTGLGTGAAAAEATGSAAVSQSLTSVAEWRLAALAAGARPEDLQAAAARRSRIAAQLDHVTAERARLTLRSPIAGVVVTKHLADRLDARLERGERFAEIHDMTAFVAEIRLPVGAPLGELQAGDDVELRPVGAPGADIACTIARLRDAADTTATDAEAADGGKVVAVTTAFATPVGHAGMVGHARLYGRRHSLAYAKLYLPLERAFRVDLWGIM